MSLMNINYSIKEFMAENLITFSPNTPIELAHKIKEWIQIFETGKNPRSEKIRWITWEQSAEKLKRKIILK